MAVNDLKNYDRCILGGGFFGCSLATYLAKKGNRVILLEQGADYLQRASYNNQARIHNGYHYPRHFLTAIRSKVNFPRFIKDFPSCIVSNFDKYYAISSKFSKVSATQFYNFMSRVGAPITKAKPSIQKLFNPELIEMVFRVQEYAFDAIQLKTIALQQMQEHNIECRLNTQVERVQKEGNQLKVSWTCAQETGALTARHVYNCTYNNLNDILHKSTIELIPLKHEITEMCLITLPKTLEKKSFTVMCGPFFSIMPFPPLGEHTYTLSHVRYTPHAHWYDQLHDPHYHSPDDYLSHYNKQSRYPAMIRDAKRYLPILEQATYTDSLWEIKTTLPSSEIHDGRPILFRRNCGLPGMTSILGGKIDNIYDAFEEIERNGE